MTEIKQGDVFRWSWKEAIANKRRESCASTVYWCMSRICIANDKGVLKDTYWHSGSSYNDVVDPDKCELRFLGNLSDYEHVDKYMLSYYADEDIMDISHCNNTCSGFYLKKGAKKSLEKIRAIIQQKIDEKLSDIRSAQYDVERLQKELEKDNVEDIFI